MTTLFECSIGPNSTPTAKRYKLIATISEDALWRAVCDFPSFCYRIYLAGESGNLATLLGGYDDGQVTVNRFPIPEPCKPLSKGCANKWASIVLWNGDGWVSSLVSFLGMRYVVIFKKSLLLTVLHLRARD